MSLLSEYYYKYLNAYKSLLASCVYNFCKIPRKLKTHRALNKRMGRLFASLAEAVSVTTWFCGVECSSLLFWSVPRGVARVWGPSCYIRVQIMCANSWYFRCFCSSGTEYGSIFLSNSQLLVNRWFCRHQQPLAWPTLRLWNRKPRFPRRVLLSEIYTTIQNRRGRSLQTLQSPASTLNSLRSELHEGASDIGESVASNSATITEYSDGKPLAGNGRALMQGHTYHKTCKALILTHHLLENRCCYC
jgi:hypothetical protein